MSVRDSYERWAHSYDLEQNHTRDLEAQVLKNSFPNPHYGNIVELGCGTGKNTFWLARKADFVKALDFSGAMIEKAKEKSQADNIEFIETDLLQDWPVRAGWANLVTCSLVLEHIEYLEEIFHRCGNVLKPNGIFYLCELHPCKQYSGSRARFESPEGLVKPPAFTHHVSDYLEAARKAGFRLLELNEHFDQDHRRELPRLLSLIFVNDK